MLLSLYVQKRRFSVVMTALSSRGSQRCEWMMQHWKCCLGPPLPSNFSWWRKLPAAVSSGIQVECDVAAVARPAHHAVLQGHYLISELDGAES